MSLSHDMIEKQQMAAATCEKFVPAFEFIFLISSKLGQTLVEYFNFRRDILVSLVYFSKKKKDL